RFERDVAGPHMGQDKLALDPLSGDDDVGRMDTHRNERVLDTHLVRLELQHQPLLAEGVDADQAVAPDIAFAQRRKLEIRDPAGADDELGDLDAVDDVAGGHAVEDHRRSERKLEVAGDALADHGGVGAAVDDEAIGAAAVDVDVDVEPGIDLARLEVGAADRERVVELGGGGGGRVG